MFEMSEREETPQAKELHLTLVNRMYYVAEHEQEEVLAASIPSHFSDEELKVMEARALAHQFVFVVVPQIEEVANDG